MIHVVIGRQGSGKTLFLVSKAYEYYKKGKTVYSNVALNFPYRKLNYDDIVNCRLGDGVVIIDEIHLLLPSRNSMSTRSRIICDNFLSQIRKRGLSLYCTSQYERKIDCRIRDEKDYLYFCSKYAYERGVWSEVMHNQDLPKKTPIIIKLEATEIFSGHTIELSFKGNDYFNLYNTKEIIKVD